jgi:hypothetical protein
MAALSSSLFYWYYMSNSDLFNMNSHLILEFPFQPSSDIDDRLKDLGGVLALSLENSSVNYNINSVTRGANTTIKYQNYLSKSIIDDIDEELGRRYSLSDAEVRFVQGYQLKYRMSEVD